MVQFVVWRIIVYVCGEDANLFDKETAVRGTPDSCFCFWIFVYQP